MTEMEEKYGTLIQAFKMTWDSFPGAAKIDRPAEIKRDIRSRYICTNCSCDFGIWFT